MPGLSFLSPLFLIAALAAAVPILLHLFHRKTEVVIDFPAVQLLTRAPAQQHRRRRLRELILLALRVAALVLLAVSFARPYLAGAAAPASAPVTVIAVDTSLSLSAPGQFEAARQAALAALDAAPASHALAVISFDETAVVAVEPTTDRGRVRSAVAQLAATSHGTRFRTAFARVTEVMAGREGRVVIITDLQQAGWEANDEGGLPDGVDVEVRSVQPPAGNLAITSAASRGGAIVGSVQNYGSLEARTTVRLFVDSKEITSKALVVASLAAIDVELQAAMPRSGVAEVRVDDPQGYQLDNARRIALDTSPATSVAIVVADPTGATGGLYLERALAVAGNGQEFRVDVWDGREVAQQAEADVRGRAALFVLGTRTLDRGGRDRIRSYLVQGGQVLLTLGPNVDPGTLADVIGTPLAFAPDPVRLPGATMIPTDGRHPVFRPFLNPSGALGDVQVDQHRRLNEHPDRVVLARFSGGDAALTEQRVGQGRLMVFTSDLDNEWSRFPLNPAFVPFVVETARYLARERQPGRSDASMADARESNPAATSIQDFTRAIERSSRTERPAAEVTARQLEDRQRWWQIGLMVMLAALAGEALIGRKAT